jgi:hypothetical protein
MGQRQYLGAVTLFCVDGGREAASTVRLGPFLLEAAMRALVAIALAVCSLALVGCCRPWFGSASDPPLPPQQYGQGTYSGPHDRPSYSDPYASPSGQDGRTPSSNGYDPASSSNPYGTVPKPTDTNIDERADFAP